MSALLTGVIIYMVAVLSGDYDGALTLIFLPFAAVFYTAIAMAFLLVVGLPLRLIRPVRHWWRSHWALPVALGVWALVMMLLSPLPALRVTAIDPDLQAVIEIPNPFLAIGGWLLILFSLLHFFPPTGRDPS